MATATKRELQLALDRFREWQREVALIRGNAGKAAGKALSEYGARLFEIIGAGTHPTGAALRTHEELDAIMAEAQRDIEGALYQAQRGIFRDTFVSLESSMQASHAAIYGAFGRTTVDQLAGAWNLYETTKREALFADGFASWTSKFVGQEGGLLREEIRRAMGQVLQTGGGRRELVAQLVNNPLFTFKNLPPVGPRGMAIFTSGGRLGEAEALVQRANVIAITEITGASNMMHEAWTREAGFSLYLNVNPEPVSKACISATAQGAMTREQWTAWSERTGYPVWPARHVRCDSQMMAVPWDYAEVSKQIDDVLAAASMAAEEAVTA